MLKISKNYPRKRAFITGAASGLGKAFTLALAKDGWVLGISDVDYQGLMESGRLASNLGASTTLYELDTSDSEHYGRVAGQFLEEHDGIDLLINNAGVGAGQELEKFGLDNWRWIVDINLMGVIHGLHYFMPVFKKQQSGYIINVSSAAAFSSAGGMSMYNATKAAVLSISETICAELDKENVKVSVVMPTFFKTNIIEKMRGGESDIKMGRYMVKRSGLEADEVAHRILVACGKGQFYIILPFQSWFFYTLKRLFPGFSLYLHKKFWKNRHRFKK